MSNPLDPITQAIDAADFEQARNLLRVELVERPTAEAFYLASLVVETAAQRRLFLEKALALNPSFPAAVEAIRKLRDAMPNNAVPPAPAAHLPTTQVRGSAPNMATPPAFQPPMPSDDAAPTTTAPTPTTSVPRVSRGHKVSSSGAALALISFFLPWALWSCTANVEPGPVSGYSLAAFVAGLSVEGYSRGEQSIGSVLFGSAPLFGGVIIALYIMYLALRAWRGREISVVRDGIMVIAIGALALVGVLYVVVDFAQGKSIRFLLGQNIGDSGGVLQSQYGLYTTFGGHLAIIAGGWLNWRDITKSRRNRKQGQ
jgi:hypothetical protein